MKPSRIATLSIAVFAMSLLHDRSAHASDPAGTTKRYGLASYPAAGQPNAGKYAEAWVDLYTNNCSNNVSGTVPLCFEAKAALQGKVPNAQVEAVTASGHVRQNVTSADNWWDCSYALAIFGKTVVNSWNFMETSAALMNAWYGQPLISNDSPFVTHGAVNLSIDLGVINSLLSILPDAVIGVNYNLNGGLTAEVDFAPLTGYGPLASVNVRPRASMSASTNSSYTFWPVRGRLYTPENVQVIAPSSSVNLLAGYAFGNNTATVTVAPNVRLLKGRVLYGVDVWGIVWNQVDSGTVWSQTSSYALYLQNPDNPTTIFSGVLPALPAITM